LAHFKPGATSATITVEPTREFSGEVTNTGGLPAENLKFYMDLRLNGDNIYRVRREPTTDADGKFTAKNLCPQASMYAWWHSDNEDNRDYDYGNADIDLSKLSPGELIRFEAKQYLNTLMGKVVDDKGQPIAKASVRMGSYDLVQQNERRKQYTTDANGDFEIPRLAPGKAELTITAKGYLTKRFHPDTDSFDFEAVLKPDTAERVNRVKIVDDEDKPLADVAVRLRISTRPGDSKEINKETRRALTDKEGVATFELKPDFVKDIFGRPIIECDVDGYDLAFVGADPREELDIVLRIHKSEQPWQAQALDMETGKPLPDATARLRSMQVEGSSNYASFPEEDRIVFEADNWGIINFNRFSKKDRISVEVSAPGYAKEQKYFSEQGPEDTVFRLSRAGKVLGKVVRTDDGELPADLRVLLTMTSGRRVREYLQVEKAGSFSWDHCAPGQYTLSAMSPTEEGRKLICPSACEAEVKAGQTVNVVVEIEKGVLVCGKKLYAEAGSTYPLRFSKAEHWCVWTKKLYVLSRRTEEALEAQDSSKALKLLEESRGHFYALHKETATFHCNDLIYEFRTEAAKSQPSETLLQAVVKKLDQAAPSCIARKKPEEYAAAKDAWKKAIGPLLDDGRIDSSEQDSLNKASEVFYRAFGIQYE